MSKALVLFSGGQDSTVCLAWALARFDEVHTIGFSYDQKHTAELKQRPIVIADLASKFPKWQVKSDQVVHLDIFHRLVDSRLLFEKLAPEPRKDGLPTTFVPGRNLIFLLVAGIVAKESEYDTLVAGMCETDFAGYPDCRAATIEALETAMNLGLLSSIKIETPLMRIDKADTWRLAYELGGNALVNTIVNHTHSCYNNDRAHIHEWGAGCGECGACRQRAFGWKRYAA